MEDHEITATPGARGPPALAIRISTTPGRLTAAYTRTKALLLAGTLERGHAARGLGTGRALAEHDRRTRANQRRFAGSLEESESRTIGLILPRQRTAELDAGREDRIVDRLFPPAEFNELRRRRRDGI